MFRYLHLPFSRSTPAFLSRRQIILLVTALTCCSDAFSAGSGISACIAGYVWREAFPDDLVCVSPSVRAQASEDNRLASSRRQSGGGAYGPDTCIEGFVWREARLEDRVCVTPEVRAQTAEDNRLANERRSDAAAAKAKTGAVKMDGSAVSRETLKPVKSPNPASIAGASVDIDRQESKDNYHARDGQKNSAATASNTPPTVADNSPSNGDQEEKGLPRMMARDTPLPTFPWPPPLASARTKLSRQLLLADQATPTNGSVVARLEQALDDNGYNARAFYAVPEGFAIATQIERIRTDFTPALEQRWTTSIDPLALVSFSLDAYIKALVGNNGDSFRVLVFVFTPISISQSDATVKPATAMAWIDKGLDELPIALAEQAYGADMVCHALVYEFRFTSVGATFQKPSAATAREHLEAAGILAKLEVSP